MIYKLSLIFTILITSLFSKEFSIASYNVENLFDLKYNYTEYREYIPNTASKWNKKNYNKKLENVAKVLKNLDASIVGLQEIESQQALDDLLKLLPRYKYSFFYKNKKAAIGLAIISKYKIIKNSIINVKSKVNRPIVKSKFIIDNKAFYIFNNHWPSKRNSESYRVNYGLSLYKEIKNYAKDIDYIILGDLNSNYNEFETFKFEKRLNDSSNLTAINHLLNTRINDAYVLKDTISHKKTHYNLWLETPYQNRFSSIYRGRDTTPDNILLSKALFDNKNISFVNGSFKVFKPKYLIKNRRINRWKMNKKVHRAAGFSDHLPIVATFNTKSYVKLEKTSTLSIKSLYELKNKATKIENIIVIYKTKDKVIIKRKSDRAIMIYKDTSSLKEGFTYDIEVLKSSRYKGLNEIIKYKILKQKTYSNSYTKLFLDASLVNILDYKYQCL